MYVLLVLLNFITNFTLCFTKGLSSYFLAFTAILKCSAAQARDFDKSETSIEIPEAVSDWMEGELAKVEKAPLKDFESASFFNREPAKLIGYIKGYDPKTDAKTGIYYAKNELTREDYPVTLEIYPDGRFEADIPLIHPVSSFIMLNDKFLEFYLEPGQTLAMILDGQDFIETRGRDYPQKAIEFRGKLANINDELSSFTLISADYNNFMKKVRTLAPEKFKKEQNALNQENKKKLSAYFAENSISPKSKTLLILKNDLKTATNILDFLMYREMEKRKDTLNTTLNTKVENSYYAEVLKPLPLNDKSLLVLRDFGSFINRFEYAVPIKFTPRFKVQNSKKSLLEYFDELGVKLTKKEKELHSRIGKGTISNEEMERIKANMKSFGDKYKKEIKAYANYLKQFDSPKMDFILPWKKKDSVMANHLHLKNELIYDITKTRDLKLQLENLLDSEGEAYAYWDELVKSIEDPFLKKEGRRLIEEKFPPKNRGVNPEGENNSSLVIKSKIIPLPDGRAKATFDALMEKHQGKIIFVDFWAIWCGPCISTIKEMKETRKKYLDDPDIDFVFITDESTPLENYRQFTGEQKLKNTYRVDKDTFNRFRQLFKFNGIPKYIALDKKGNLIDDNFQMSQFKTRLPEILKKY